MSRIVTSNRPQVKYFEDYFATETLDPTNVIYQMCYPDEGDTDLTRNGEEIKVFSGLVRLIFSPIFISTGTANTLSYWQYRVVMFIDMDTQPSGSPPVISDLLDLNTITDPLLARKSWDNRKRFRFLYDRTHVFQPFIGAQASANPSGTVTDKTAIQELTIRKKMNLRMKFNGSTGTTLGKNMVYLMIISNTAAAANTNQMQVRYASRFLFTDA